MTDLTLCTFNLENLFTRFDFAAFTDERARRYLPPVVRFLGDFGDGDLSKFPDFKRLMEGAAVAQDDDHRQHTALALAEAGAQVVLLQEVDSLDALSRFASFYLAKVGGAPNYPNLILQEGNDPRGIDVAAMTRDIAPTYARSHAGLTRGGMNDLGVPWADWPLADAALKRGRVFRRDALELEVIRGGQRVTLFNCHFKSMGGGREASIGTRQAEALAVRALIEDKFDDPAAALWAVAGDLNDYRTVIKIRADGSEDVVPLAEDAPSGIDPLIADGFGVDLIERMPQDERWTHYWASGRQKTALDRIIASPALAEMAVGAPIVIRAGLPFRVPNLDVPRYPRMGWDRPKASDHCPVVVRFDL